MKKTAFLLCALVLAHSPAYAQPPKGVRMECLGYHQAEVPGEFEAATEAASENAYLQIGGGRFTDALGVMGDGYDNGELTVEVSQPTTREAFDKFIPRKLSLILGKLYEPAQIQEARSTIKRRKEAIADLEKEKGSYDPEHFRAGIQRAYETVARNEARIKAWEEIPEIWVDKDTYYYGGWLWLWRAPRIFRIRLNREGIPEDQSRQEATLAVVPRFQTRALGEIPGGPGFCVPYGFVKGIPAKPSPYKSQTTLRLKGEPGLLYTVRFQSDKLTDAAASPGSPQISPYQVLDERIRLVGQESALSGWYGAPYQETKLPGGRYRVVRKRGEQEEVYERTEPQGEVFVLQARVDGVKDDPLRPAVLTQFTGVSFALDPSLEGRAIPSLEQALPTLRQFLASIRLREENAQALGAARK